MIATILINENGEGRIAPEIIRALGLAPKSHVDADIIVKEVDPLRPRDIPPDKTVQDFLNEYEAKYGMTSAECSRKLEHDEIGDDPDLLRWMGFYEIAKRAVARGENPAEIKFTLVTKISQRRQG